MANKVSIILNGEEEPPQFLDVLEVEKFVLKLLADLKYTNWELSIVFCDNKFIHNLNRQYRGIDQPTDVLSFEQGDEYIDENDETVFVAGDIIISIDAVHFNAKEFSVDVNEELKRLLIHGVLHLAGYDHSDNSPEQEMLKLQEKILLTYNDWRLM